MHDNSQCILKNLPRKIRGKFYQKFLFIKKKISAIDAAEYSVFADGDNFRLCIFDSNKNLILISILIKSGDKIKFISDGKTPSINWFYDTGEIRWMCFTTETGLSHRLRNPAEIGFEKNGRIRSQFFKQFDKIWRR